MINLPIKFRYYVLFYLLTFGFAYSTIKWFETANRLQQVQEWCQQ